MGRRATWTRRAVALSGGMTVAALGLGVAPASAAPSNAPHAFSGIFECETFVGPGVDGFFVVNTGASQATTWNSAHLTFVDGATGTGLFHPNGFSLSFNGGPSQIALKNNFSLGPWLCSIEGSDQAGNTISGEVSGSITFNG